MQREMSVYSAPNPRRQRRLRPLAIRNKIFLVLGVFNCFLQIYLMSPKVTAQLI
jgi:hypothetical protein